MDTECYMRPSSQKPAKLMKRTVTLILLLSPFFLLAQSNKHTKLQVLVDKHQYNKACQKADKWLKKDINKKHLSKEHIAGLWYYKGKAYSASYFQKVNELRSDDNDAYGDLSYLIDEAINSFQATHELSRDVFQVKAFQQINALHQFLSMVSKRYYKIENYERYYVNAKRARICNLYVHDHSPWYKDPYPIDTKLMYSLAYAAELTKRDEEAITLYEQLLNMGDDQQDIYKNTSHLYLSLGDTIKAINVLDYGTSLYPNSKELLYYKLDLLLNVGMYEEAYQEAENAHNFFPSLKAELYFIQGSTYDRAFLASNEDSKTAFYFERATKAYRQAISHSPNTYTYSYNLAALYYNKVLLLSPTIEDSFERQEEYIKTIKEAKLALENAYQLDKKQESIISALEFIYERTNEVDKLESLKVSRG